MRQFKLVGLFVFALVAAISVHAQLSSVTNLFNYQAVTGTPAVPVTNNSTSVAIGGVYIPATPLIIQNSTFAPTNTSLTVNEQISLDGANFYTIASYNPAVTNAGISVFNPTISSQTIYLRTQIITTNGMSVGVTAQ